MQGPFCYACGQSRDGMIRRFSNVLSDFLNTVFALDSRLLRSLVPLYFRPGFLTAEYVAGRRIRYVGPVQLFVFLCITAFFAVQVSSDWKSPFVLEKDGERIAAVDADYASAGSVEEVESIRRETLSDLEELDREGINLPSVRAALEPLKKEVNAAADRRIVELGGELDPDSAQRLETTLSPTDPKEKAAPESADADEPSINLIDVEGLPEPVSQWIERYEQKINENFKRVRADPNLFKDALLGALPSTLFVLLPIFALILKPLYLFSKRLYMEHLIVALHSHAFLSLSLLLLALVSVAEALAKAGPPWLQSLLDYTWLAVFWWMPIYLLLMQKRVYGQGWALTLGKFSLLGWIYFILLVLATTFTAIRSMANL
ncbi:hypothetical protein AUP74_01262 [Microbulbifer aggregans]|uniref:DUF3667 domain-containing protein n=1 Tax=Microbulbifer aggregans TaxID=1769779 RepID=A0A1C9W6D9_9GAMM|nr:DUF3667 domain-containing protein [Microbulbifer aggregans]AOS96722.1 hypothetical protein AUP74_01262 [Microbulbifer aggregans]